MIPDWLRLLETLAATNADRKASPESRHPGDGAREESEPFDRARLSVMLFEEGRRIHLALARLFIEPYLRTQLEATTPASSRGHGFSNGRGGAPATNDPDGASAGRSDEDDIFTVVRQAQKWLLQHPAAAQAVFSALVAEGRRFAETESGARWAHSLAASELVRKGRMVWESATLNMLEERADTVVPSTYLEVLRSALETPDFEELLEQLRNGGGVESRGEDGNEPGE